MTGLPAKVLEVLAAAERSQQIPAGEIECCPDCIDLAAKPGYGPNRLRLIHEMHHRSKT